ncbi:ATP12 family chaperone protein [Rhizobium alvei]|uniref:ATP12 family chaperone protein n=1 Tax=Rhizobium alvei TaxID=1132659 RepID=A0ABT8YHF2_9HYPH|nr:ATP12 family chaperone protein [Rhizobium alvei]MDO6963102.1 ATP12 family chaperone protein [Rhizobium alvei]
MRDIFSDLSAPTLSDPDPTRRAQIQMKQPLPKRFYKDVSISEIDGEFAVLLDGRPVKTPGKNKLSLPTVRAAELVAAEWQAQETEINPGKMPLTRLANTAIDGIANEVDAVFDDMLKFAGTDLLCYRADDPENLVNRQNEVWDPVVRWAAETLGARFILVAGIMHHEQPVQALSATEAALAEHKEAFRLACLHTMTTLMGSAILATAYAHGRLTAEEAWKAAHVDEDYQIDLWGTDAEAEARRAARWTEFSAAARLFEAITGRC